MKTTLHDLIKKMVLASAMIVSGSLAYGQCTTSTSITQQGGGTINLVNQSTGANPNNYVDISFGDGTYDSGSGLSFTTSHTYTNNGMYIVYANFYSVDPLDSTNYCHALDMDTVFISGLPSQNCTLQAFVGSYDNGYNLANSAYIFGYTQGNHTGSHFIIEGQSYWNTDSILYTFPSPGDYSVCYYAEDTTSGSFCFDSVCTNVHISVPTPQPQCYSNFYLYEDSLNAGVWYALDFAYTANPGSTVYTWDFGDGTTSNLQYPTHTYANPGVYTVCLTVSDLADSCSATYCDSTAGMKLSSAAMMSSLTVVASTTGVKDQAEHISKTTVYPNPMADISTIIFESASSMTGKIQIVNLLGAVVYSENTSINKGANTISLNTASLTAGMYYVNIIGNNQLLGTVKAVK